MVTNLPVSRCPQLQEVLIIGVHGVAWKCILAIRHRPSWSHQLHPRAHNCREQHGGPAAGLAGRGDHGGPEEREHRAGPRGQRGRLHEHTYGGCAVPGQTGSARTSAGSVHHWQEHPLRSYPRPHGHNEDHTGPAGQDPQSPQLCPRGWRQKRVRQEKKISWYNTQVEWDQSQVNWRGQVLFFVFFRLGDKNVSNLQPIGVTECFKA